MINFDEVFLLDPKRDGHIGDTYSVELEEYAINGNSAAQNYLGICYMEGKGVDVNPQKAFYWLTKAAENGNIKALNNLGWCYEKGFGVDKNDFQAYSFYKTSALKGHEHAYVNLAQCYMRGVGTQPDTIKAIAWFEKAAELGFRVAQTNAGFLNFYQGDYTRAVHWLTLAVNNQDPSPNASELLAYIYEEGLGVRKDISKAIFLYEKAYSLGNSSVKTKIDILYKQKENYTKNETEKQEESGKFDDFTNLKTLLEKEENEINLFAGNGKITNALLIERYYRDHNYDKIIAIADDVVKLSTVPLDEGEIEALLYGTKVAKDSTKLLNYKKMLLSDPSFNEQLNSISDYFSSIDFNMVRYKEKSVNEKKVFSIKLVQMFSEFEKYSNFFEDQIFRDIDIVKFFHECIFGYRSIFDKNDLLESVILMDILLYESDFLLNHHLYQTFLYNIFQEIKDLNSSNYLAIQYCERLTSFENLIIESSFTENGKSLYNERCDFILYLLELTNFANSFGYHKYYYSHKDLVNSLASDEAILLMYNYEINDIHFVGSIYIDSNGVQPNDMPLDLVESTFSGNNAVLKNNPSNIIDRVLEENPNIKALYVCPIDLWQNTDIAYTNSTVHLKHSFVDIIFGKKKNIYSNGIVSFYGDLDYGEGDIKPLPFSKIECHELSEVLGDKFRPLSGKDATRSNFLNRKNDISVFHISTHGVHNFNQRTNLERYTMMERILYSESMSKQVIALSNYNDNPANNSINALDIINRPNSNCDLVFLSACELGLTYRTLMGRIGVSLSFSLSGASNVISYLTPVDDEIACDFAVSFYKNLMQSDSKNYHEVFFKTKIEIIDKYKNQLLDDDLGRPRLDVVLWE